MKLKAKLTKIKDILNNMRGVCLIENKIENDGIIRVCYTAECQRPLTKIVGCANGSPMWSEINSYNCQDLEYSIIFFKDYIDEVLKSLEWTVNFYEGINEEFKDIEQYDKLDAHCQQKYWEYIKYLRKRFVNGWEEKSAKELLDMGRYCDTCGKELFTKDDEIRTIVEFDTPERAYEVLDEIICDKDDQIEQ